MEFSEVKQLLDALLWEIYGRQREQQLRFRRTNSSIMTAQVETSATELNLLQHPGQLQLLNERQLMDVSAILKVEIRIIGHCLERVLCTRERLSRNQEVLCEFVDAILHIGFTNDAHPKMHFSLSPPLPKADFTALTSIETDNNTNNAIQNNHIINFNNNNKIVEKREIYLNKSNNNNYQLVNDTDDEKSIIMSTQDSEATSDYKQWLHAMKLVAHLPGGMPPEFRHKLWLSLADKYLKSKNIDWAKEEEKCFCEKWREDDEELGIQIVKDLHRTGSNLCTGPTGTINQAKLKRILLGYARYNPEVGYCQGFNMMGALILQVMDKNEFESMKVMIYLVEGVLPLGYFHGSMGGLQADMGVFRELMQTKLPRLAKHLQKLQGPVENAYEPPLTNVFTMQWFLTLFCTCLPMSCVLRVWDLVLIEGSDVLLRTALVLWGLLEDRVLSARTADEFYCKMGSFSGELLNGHLIDSNGLIERVVLLGPIPDIQRLRDKHLYNIAPLRNNRLYYDDDEGESDDESRLAVATVWGLPWGRRGSADKQTPKQPVESRERLALDISLLKKQYDRLRERQKQAQLIITTACNTARQTASPALSTSPNLPVNQLLNGRQAIMTNRGKRLGAATKFIPPARKPSLPAVLQCTKLPDKQLRRGETLHWRDTDLTKQRRRDSLTWKEIKADRESILLEGVETTTKQPSKLRSRLGKSDSSSYSEESDGEEEGSSSDTSLCDDDDLKSTEESPKRRPKTPRRKKALLESVKNKTQVVEKVRPKSWAPTTQEIPFTLMSSDSPQHSGDEKVDGEKETAQATTAEHVTRNKSFDETDWAEFQPSSFADELIPNEIASLPPAKDIVNFQPELVKGDVGKTNLLFGRTTSIERPKKLNLFYSLNEEDSIRNAYLDGDIKPVSKYSNSEPNVLGRTAKEFTTSFIKNEDLIKFEMEPPPKSSSNNLCAQNNCSDSKKISTLERLKNKRRDPRRMTLARSTTIDIEERYQALEKTDILRTYDDRETRPNRKTIPSTADLEERYNILERQLSGNSDKSAHRNDTEDDHHCSSFPNRPMLKPEKLFTTLSQQMSSSDSNTKLNESKPSSQREDSSPSKRREDTCHKNESQEESEAKIASSPKSTGKIDDESREEEKPRLKKLPSTAELEDRFNALERRLSAQKSPSKSKKEPPDGSESPKHHREFDNTEKQKTSKLVEIENTEKDKNNNRDKRNERMAADHTVDKTDIPNVQSPKATKEFKSAQVEDRSQNSLNLSREQERSEDSKEKINDFDKECKEKAKLNGSTPDHELNQNAAAEKTSKPKDEREKLSKSPAEEPVLRKKCPPSTEELESRYRALEKQLTVNQIEMENCDQEIEEPKKSPKTDHTEKAEVQKENKSPLKETPKIRQDLDQDHNEESVPQKEDESKQQGTGTSAAKEPQLTAEQQVNHNKNETKRDKQAIVEPDKRRGSEPPSTADLEKRFENLKRRMSSRNMNDKTLTKAEMLAKYSHRTAHDEIEEPVNEEETIQKSMIEETNETDITKAEIIIEKGNPPEPPTTEDLESRFEALQLKSETKPQKPKGKITHVKQITKSKTECFEDDISRRIPLAPPLPMSNNTEALNLIIPMDNRRTLQQALVEELLSKIKTSPDGSNIKPSLINPNRRILKVSIISQNKAIDGTSETHAKSASLWSENDELWQQKKSVRRFSDLPSRADLENRLEFLERQLFEKFKKQRCASDSEVTSMKSIGAQTTKPPQHYEEMPSTSKSQPAPTNNLEERVQAIEKQLSENSLKLLDAVRQITQEQLSSEEVSLSRHLSTEIVDPTGKELVRYTNSGELVDAETHKPFNINIHIKISLKNKEDEKEKKTEKLPTTEELEKRLQILEQQIRDSKLQQLENTRILRQAEDAVEVVNEKKQENVEKKDKLSNIDGPEKTEAVKDKETNLETAEKNQTSTNHPIEEKTESVQLKEKDPNAESKIKNNNNEFAEESKKQDETKLAKSVQSEEKIEQEKSKINCASKNENDEKVAIKIPDEIEKPLRKPQAETNQVITAGDEKAKLCEKTNNVPEKEKPDISTETMIEQKEQVEEKVTSGKEPKTVSKSADKVLVGISDPVDANEKAVVLLVDDEPKAVKVRRLTRANTEELEGLFQALEKQLSDRNLVKSDDGKLFHALEINEKLRCENQKICSLTKEIEKLSNADKVEIEDKPKEKVKIEEKIEKKEEVETKKKEDEPFDWGSDPVKRHLKRKTVYLPSTKELEARFRSFERQIKFLEDVEKIDVEQRLSEIERKIKLQYSLSHEKDLNKFLDLCDGKEIEGSEATELAKSKDEERSRSPKNTRSQKNSRTPQGSPGRKSKRSPYQSPVRSYSHESPYTSPVRSNKHSPYTSPLRSQTFDDSYIPSTEDLEYRYRALDLKRANTSKKELMLKKQPIHPLEMLLDPSPEDSNIPTTGELEHRMRILEEKRKTPTSPKSSRSKSPKFRKSTAISDISPTYQRGLPTADELEARVRALEEDHCFDFKTQKNYKEFTQKLKDAVTPSLSFEEFEAIKSREQSPKRKSALRESEYDSRPSDHVLRSTSPKVIRFAEDRDAFDEGYTSFHGRTVGNSNEVLEMIGENSKILQRILKKTFTDSNSSIYSTLAAAEGLEARGARLLRETSPMRRTGTHTGVPLKQDLNINDRLDSIKNSIKSIDQICEEKPYKKEKCQRYIDSLFTDSVHFSKKSSLEDLRRRDYGPSIRVSDHCERPSGRTIGSAESIRSTSPLRAASPPHHRSNRELRREIEEHESRVRRGNNLPKSHFLDNSNVSRDNSLTEFYKVDRQLDQYKYDDERYLSNSPSTSRSPLRSPYGSTDMMMHKLTTTTTTTTTPTTNTLPTLSSRLDFNRPEPPYRPASNNSAGYEYYKRPSNSTPVYNPGKLEIRHTTVTSTFYDRLLAEKQIEKNLNRSPNKSPVVSPSITSKSYTDAAQASRNVPLTSPKQKSPTIVNNVGPQVAMTALANTTSAHISQAPYQHNQLPFSYTNPLPFTTTSNTTTTPPTTQQHTNALGSYNNSFLSLTTPNTITSTANNIGATQFSYSPIPLNTYNLTTSTNTNTQPISDAAVNPLNSTTSISTGVYNPIMPYIMRQPPDAATITSLNVLEHNLTASSTICPTSMVINGNYPKL